MRPWPLVMRVREITFARTHAHSGYSCVCEADSAHGGDACLVELEGGDGSLVLSTACADCHAREDDSAVFGIMEDDGRVWRNS